MRRILFAAISAIPLISISQLSVAQELERYVTEQDDSNSATIKIIKGQGEGYRCKAKLSGYTKYSNIYFFKGKKYIITDHGAISRDVTDNGDYIKWEETDVIQGIFGTTRYEFNRKSMTLTSLVFVLGGVSGGMQKHCSRIDSKKPDHGRTPVHRGESDRER